MENTMEDIFIVADELGPAKVIHVYEPSLGLKAVLVVDNIAARPSIGGLRLYSLGPLLYQHHGSVIP